jgi:hypothetical protein
MKRVITVMKEVDIKKVRVSVAVRYDEEDIPKDFPMRSGNMWNATIDIETGKIFDWPQGKSGNLHMKVCDEGSYYLLDENDEEVLSIEGDYVPNRLIPGTYGDYIDLKIDSTGTITNWYSESKISIEDFEDNF